MEHKTLKKYKALRNSKIFKKGNLYLFLGEEIINNEGVESSVRLRNEKIKLLSDEDTIVLVDKANFILESETLPIKEVYCCYSNENNFITNKKLYSVFKIVDEDELDDIFEANDYVYYEDDDDEDDDYDVTLNQSEYSEFFDYNYLVIDDRGILTFYPKDFFMDKDKFDNLNNSNKLEQELKIIQKELNNTLDIEDEMSIQDREELKKVNCILNHIKSCEKQLSNKNLNKKVIDENKGQTKFIICQIISCLFLFLDIPIMRNIIIVSNLLILIIMFLVNKDMKKKLNSNNNINGYINNLNKLNAENLAKIKIIENELVKINKNNSKEIAGLINESLIMTINLIDNFNGDFNELNKEVSEFIDNIMKYINSLKDNSEVENKQVEKQIALTIYDTIKRNNEVFQSMTKDNNEINKYFK